MRYIVKAEMPKYGADYGTIVGYNPSQMALTAPTPGSDDLFDLYDPNTGDGGAEVSMYLSELEGLLVVAVRALAAHHGSTYRTVLDRALDTLVREDAGK